jgi:5'-nucleotidase
MRLSSIFAGAALLSASSSQALNILLNNDDGFGSGNLRETYRLLKGKGHNVWLVAPATKQSGKGGASDFTTEGNLTAPSQYDLIPKGAPSVGSDPKDSQIWYYNGTPAACTFVALDYVLPRYANFSVPDLVVTGPNFGTNLGGFVWTLSGTAGAAYAATHRGIPAIAISASNQEVPYTELTNRTNPATWAAEAAVKFVDNFISTAPKNGPLLPNGYGVSVNIPVLTKKDHDPDFVQTRFTGNAHVNEAVLDKDKGTFTWANIKPYAAGVNACINGDCSLPGETYVVENGQASVSFYTVDYSAPSTAYTQSLIKRVASFISGDK